MLEGIEVLNTYQQIVKTPWTWTIWGTILLIVGIGWFILAISYSLNNNDGFQAVFGFLGMAFVAGGIALNLFKNPVYQDVYEVTITDEVSINELTNKYDIIKQEGKIYHLVEKQ